MNRSNARIRGAVVALGGIVWGAAMILSPSRSGHNSQVEIWAGGVFQIGLLALLTTMWSTHALGTGRPARWILTAETIVLVLAMAWTVAFAFDANRPNKGVLAVLDACWPLSMIGLMLVGLYVARAGQWPNPLRYLPLLASLLLPIDLAVSWAPSGVRTTVTGVYLALAYGLLGGALVSAAEVLSSSAPAALTIGNQTG
jgi:hypothetical protein